jgi:hypothetical protein
VADFFANGRATRLAQGADVTTQAAQSLGEDGNLRGFSAAFSPFECNEKTFHQAQQPRERAKDLSFDVRRSAFDVRCFFKSF